MDSLLLPILIPAVAGLLALLLPDALRLWRTPLGIVGSLATFVTGAWLIDATREVAWPWLTLGPLEVELAFRVDLFSGWAVALVGLLAFLTAIYAAGWFRRRGGAPGRYYAYLLIALSGACGVLLADNLLVLVICWEIVTLMLFLFVISGREDGGKGAAKAFAMLGIGDMALLVAVVLLGLQNDSLSMSVLRATPVACTSAGAILAWLLLFGAACAKAGAMPLHSWIPSMATGTHASVMAFLPGSLDKVLGIYLLARISLDWFAPTPALRMVVMTVGAVTILGGVFMAMVQHDLRRLLSFHAVSQVGYMLLGIGTGTVIGVMGGLFHMVNNAIYKACLFLGAGSVERETGESDLSKLGGLVKTMPVTFACMFTAALAISGIPPLNGFVSKWFVYQGCVAANQPVFLIAAIFGSALTLASFVKVLHSVFWGATPRHLDGASEGDGGIGMPIAMITLAVLCVALGVFAAYPLDRFIGPIAGLEAGAAVNGAMALDGARELWAPIGGTAPAGMGVPGTFAPLAVTGLLVLGVLAALLLAYLGHMRARRVRSVFIGGEPLDRERNRFPGTEFYRDVQEMPALGRALGAASKGRFDLYRIFGAIGRPIIRVLRRLHSGLVTDYLAWCLLGLAVVLATLFAWR